jgi:hypothetical protein
MKQPTAGNELAGMITYIIETIPRSIASKLTEALIKLETMDNGVIAFWIAHQLDALPQ